MATAGLPDVSTLSTYGGQLVNAYPVSNPNTDLDASAGNQAMADCAGMTHTAARFWAVFTTASTTAALTLAYWNAVWADSTPTPPALTRSTTGTYTVTVPQLVTDALNGQHAVNFRYSGAQLQVNTGSPTLYFPVSSPLTNVITVLVYGTGSSPALSDGPAQLYVWAG